MSVVLGHLGAGARARDWLPAVGVALIMRVTISLAMWTRVPPTADGKFYHVVAERIANGEGYTWLWPDGAVTFAAHFPVGYPALMAPLYGVFGPLPGAVMLLNSVLGVTAVWAMFWLSYELLQASPFSRFSLRGAQLSSFALAVFPTLILYTPAMMTEGAVASLLSLAAVFTLFATRSSRGGFWLFCSCAILCLGGASLMRPQSVLLAPVLGFFASRSRLRTRAIGALIFLVGTLACLAPWIQRNCDKMEQCVFVSANGGWNLLIGTFPEGRGAWVALEGERVPQECREVFQEAAKDSCFKHAGLRRISENPIRWVSLVPAKLRATFDYAAAGSDHLSEAGALRGDSKSQLSGLELISQRIWFLFALLGGGGMLTHTPLGSTRKSLVYGAVAVGSLGFAGLGAWWAWLVVIALWAASGRLLAELPVASALGGLLATLVVHAVFFGAGRYSLPVIVAVAPLSAVGIAYVCGHLEKLRARVS